MKAQRQPNACHSAETDTHLIAIDCEEGLLEIKKRIRRRQTQPTPHNGDATQRQCKLSR